MTNAVHPSDLLPGTVVYVPIKFGATTVWHPGITTDSWTVGEMMLPTIVNASKRRGFVVEESWSDFTAGQAAHVVAMPASVSVEEMLRRARADVGKEWSLFAGNCEHQVRRWRGLTAESPQLQIAVGAAVVAAVAVVAIVLVARAA